MSIGYGITLVVLGSWTALALWPLRRPWILGRLSYLLGVGVIEMPQVAAACLVSATVLTALDGHLGGAAGLAAMVGAGLILAGQAVLFWRALQARRVVSAAVAAAVGRRPPRRTFFDTARILLTPYPARRRDIVRVADLQYAPGGRRHRLDVYRRNEHAPRAPVLLYLHGGGYFSGDKHREGRALVNRMTSHGWVCVSANYRLRPGAGFADHLTDAKLALAWVREHVAEYGGDPGTVVISGSSAGGHLAVLAALTPNEPALQPGFEAADTAVAAAVGLYGYYGSYYERSPQDPVPSSPLAHAATDAPPVFLAHGDHDTQVPVQGARDLCQHLRTGSTQPVAYAELPGAQHGFDLYHSVRYEAVIDGVEVFLSEALAPVPTTAR